MKMRRKVVSLALASVVLLMAIPAFASQDVTVNDSKSTASYGGDMGIMEVVQYKVISNNVAVKSSPGLSSPSLGNLKSGVFVYYYGEPMVNKDGYTWMYVSCGSPINGFGWIASIYLQ